jgi:hypothetical protein
LARPVLAYGSDFLTIEKAVEKELSALETT